MKNILNWKNFNENMSGPEGEIKMRIKIEEPLHYEEILRDFGYIADEHFSAGNYDARSIAHQMIFEWQQKKK